MLRYTLGEKDASFSPIANGGALACQRARRLSEQYASEPILFGISDITEGPK
jgi:hypothetical protein